MAVTQPSNLSENLHHFPPFRAFPVFRGHSSPILEILECSEFSRGNLSSPAFVRFVDFCNIPSPPKPLRSLRSFAAKYPLTQNNCFTTLKAAFDSHAKAERPPDRFPKNLPLIFENIGDKNGCLVPVAPTANRAEINLQQSRILSTFFRLFRLFPHENIRTMTTSLPLRLSVFRRPSVW